MATIVTLDVFSGRRNPSWILSEEHSRELFGRLGSIRDLTLQKPATAAGGVGYRGFDVVDLSAGGQVGRSVYIAGGIAETGAGRPNLELRSGELEHWLLGTAAAGACDDAVVQHVKATIEQAGHPGTHEVGNGCPPCVAAQAPSYEPWLWNTPAVQPYNNCYNYANDQITNTFAQPGRGSGHPFDELTCDAVSAAAQSDGLVPSPNFSNPLSKGWYVALVIWPNMDYHWYRQDDTGCWSHKAGGTPATDLDAAGNVITDPQTANRGPYTVFCTYMVTTSAATIA